MNDFKIMQKADLHVHLNGLVSTTVFVELLKPYVKDLPDWFDLHNDMILRESVGSLTEYLRPWYGFKLVPRSRAECSAMVNSAICNLSEDNITYAEIRNSPFNICEMCSESVETILNWLCDMLQEANDKFKIQTKLVVSLSRYKLEFEKAKLLVDSIKKVNRPDVIVGLDISGNEDEPIDGRIANLMRRTKNENGLGITVHAGETGSHQNIEWAIHECQADRIGHACALPNSPELADAIREKDICIECCISSNILSGAVQSLNVHPVHFFAKNRIPFVICSDNPSVHAKTLSDEYSLFVEMFGDSGLLDDMHYRQLKYSFGG